ncbi:lymphocyte-specific protein 1 [Rhynochetos jubatus]
MTSAILRRNSSKQGLQNLIRLTAQWSVEDEEEAARERRRREREKQLRSQAEEGLNGPDSCSESAGPAQENHYDFKPSGTSELEEDEGFSDWSQKLEQRKQRSPRQSYEEEDGGVREAEVKLEQIQLDQESPEEIQEENVVIREEERLYQGEEQVQEQEEEESTEQEVGSGGVDLLSPELVGELGLGAALQELSSSLLFMLLGVELTQTCFPGVTWGWCHSYVLPWGPGRQALPYCEGAVFASGEKKRRRNEDEEETPEKRQKAPSPASLEEEELCSDNSAVCSMKITDRTESLNRSIKKSNSIKKTQPPLPVSKIDDRLEQYTQAIETSTKTPKPVRQPSLDLPTTSMVVASTKSLWETGEVAAQSAVKSSPCKDIVAGDIVSKRSLWEQKGNPKPETSVKANPSGKKYKFVATGHGQYKKVLIDDAAEQ